jgi:GT2 family glycosyltransferase
MRIAILMTVFNRILQTNLSLLNLYEQIKVIDAVDFQVFITDGGSNDGTFELISQAYPQAHLYKRQGAYWNKGMWNSWTKALESNFDFYLWLNDDVDLFEGTMAKISTILSEQEIFENMVLVGSTREPNSNFHSYGPLKIKHRYSPLNFEIDNSDGTNSVTFNGNFVLVPRNVVAQIGILDDRFSHSFGDIDYGLRASKCGIQIVNLPFSVGSCPKNREWSNIQNGNSSKVSLSFILQHPKGIPYKEWLLFTKKHGGKLWLLRFFWRYLIFFTRLLKSKLSARF